MTLLASRFGFRFRRLATRKSRLQTPSGFTLLEVVVALAIVGLGVVTLLELFSLGLRLGARSAERSEAVFYGAQVMEQTLIRRQLRDGGEQGSAGRHRWKLEVTTPARDSELTLSSNWELKEISLALGYQDGGGEKQFDIKTLRLMKKTTR